MSDERKLGAELIRYCEKYSVPLDHVFDISNDQKVVGNAIERFLGKSEKEIQRVTETSRKELKHLRALLWVLQDREA